MKWHWWTQIEAQVMNWLIDLAAQGIYADDVFQILEENDWLRNRYVKDAKVCFNRTEVTLSGLNDMFTLLTGGYEFEGALKFNIKKLLDKPEIQRTEEVA